MKAKVSLLHVEDDTDFAHVVHLHLNRIALQRAAPSLSFTVATSVDQALALLEDSSFDAILSDYQICGGTGLDVLARVRASGLDIPFIFFTGQGDESVAREAFVSGADDYYAKDMGIAAYERIYNALVHQISHYAMEREKLEYKKRVDVSEQRYHLLFSSAPDAIFVLGNRSFVDCNPAAEAMFGYSREELLGRMPHELSPAQQPDGSASLEKAQMQMDRVLDGASHRFTWEHLRKDGSTFAADVFLTTFSDGREEYLLAMVRDLSDAQRTARQLAEQRRKLSSLIGNLPGMAYQCSTDPDERIRYVSRGVKELLGGSRRELALYPSGSLSALVHPGDRAARQASIERAVSAGEHYDISYRMRKKDGTYVRVHERGQQALDTDGNEVLEGFIMGRAVKDPSNTLSDTLVRLFDLMPLGVVIYEPHAGAPVPVYTNAAANEIEPVVRASGGTIPFHDYLSNEHYAGLLAIAGHPSEDTMYHLSYEGPQGVQYYGIYPFYLPDGRLCAVCRNRTGRIIAMNSTQSAYERMERILDVFSQVNVLDIEQILAAVSLYLQTIIRHDGLTIFAIDHERGALVPRYCDEDAREAVMPFVLPIDSGVTGRVARTGCPSIVNRAQDDPDVILIPGTPDDGERLMSIPLRGRMGVIGVMNLYRSQSDFFYGDIETVQSVSAHVAATLENALLFEKQSREHEFMSFLISLLSHDLNNTLMVAEGLTDALGEGGASLVPRLRRVHRRMNKIIERTQIISRLEYGKMGREYRLMSVATLLDEVNQHFSDHPRSGGVTISCSCNAQTLYALDILPHLVINLVDNALKYGGSCTVLCSCTHDALHLLVADKGPGIPSDHREDVFLKYARLERASGVSGSGIGLFLAKRIAELHRGTIEIRDNEPVGTVFAVTLPFDGRPKGLSSSACTDVCSSGNKGVGSLSPKN